MACGNVHAHPAWDIAEQLLRYWLCLTPLLSDECRLRRPIQRRATCPCCTSRLPGVEGNSLDPLFRGGSQRSEVDAVLTRTPEDSVDLMLLVWVTHQLLEVSPRLVPLLTQAVQRRGYSEVAVRSTHDALHGSLLIPSTPVTRLI